MAEESTTHLSTDDLLHIRAAEQRLDALLQGAERAKAEGRLAEMIRDTPSVREQTQSHSDFR